MKELIAPPEIAWKLDEYQLAATQAPLGNTCVFAVAGSGKTTLLTHRVANLIYHGVPEGKILLITFTNQAAKEMGDRIKKVLKKTDLAILSGTFHSVANAILRLHDEKRHSVLDDEDARALLSSVRSDYAKDYDIPLKELPSAKVMLSVISGSINHNVSIGRYLKMKEFDSSILAYRGVIKDIQSCYNKKKKEIPSRDFDDLLLDIVNLFETNKEALKLFTEHYPYVFVDEYQDINWMQYRFLELINKNDNMFVVGDRAQCIYQFRGSKDEYMESFEQDYKNVNTYFLKRNYRSTPEILHLAEKSINKNKYKYKIELHPFQKNGPVPLVIPVANQMEEAAFVVSDIKERYEEHYDDVVILLRTNRQAKAFESECYKQDVPCIVIGLLSFYRRAHIKDIISVVSFAHQNTNYPAFFRIVKKFPGIGDVTIKKMWNCLQENDYDIEKAMQQRNLNKKELTAWDTLLHINKNKNNISNLVEEYLSDHYEKYLNKEYEDAKERIEDIMILLEQFPSNDIELFLEKVALEQVEKEKKDNGPKVKIMTMHKAKGLEWEHVYIPSMNYMMFPSRIKYAEYYQNSDNVKAERNLFYVAVTRAKKTLIMSYYINYRYYKRTDDGGVWTDSPSYLSPFIKELQTEGVE